MKKVGDFWFLAALTLWIKSCPSNLCLIFHGSFSFVRIFPAILMIFIDPHFPKVSSPKMTEMIELEDQEELLKNEQDVETAAYKEAFDHFDWNHSGRIPTSVSE